MTWYVVFRGRKPGVYDSWGVCSKYVLDFSGATYRSYLTRMEVEKLMLLFLNIKTPSDEEYVAWVKKNGAIRKGASNNK
jgi:viroplasmin and RNaseH domain-containing protein